MPAQSFNIGGQPSQPNFTGGNGVPYRMADGSVIYSNMAPSNEMYPDSANPLLDRSLNWITPSGIGTGLNDAWFDRMVAMGDNAVFRIPAAAGYLQRRNLAGLGRIPSSMVTRLPYGLPGYDERSWDYTYPEGYNGPRGVYAGTPNGVVWVPHMGGLEDAVYPGSSGYPSYPSATPQTRPQQAAQTKAPEQQLPMGDFEGQAVRQGIDRGFAGIFNKQPTFQQGRSGTYIPNLIRRNQSAFQQALAQIGASDMDAGVPINSGTAAPTGATAFASPTDYGYSGTTGSAPVETSAPPPAWGGLGVFYGGG